MVAATKKSKTTLNLIKILEKRYGKKPPLPSWGFMETLLFYIIYYTSGITAARRTFKIIREEYVDLNEVRVSSLNEIRNTLRKANANEQVAYQLRSMLKQIFRIENAITLAGMEELPPDQVKRYFSRLEHLPAHAVDYLLLVKCKHPVLPVDGQVSRMAKRLGLVPVGTRVAQAQRTLMRNMNSDMYYDFYTLFLEHATKVCTARARCSRCVLLKQCKHGKAASGKKRK
jgi:endonuclease III